MKSNVKTNWRPDVDFFKLIKDILDLIMDYVIKHNDTNVSKDVILKSLPEVSSMFDNSEKLQQSTTEYLNHLILINKLKHSN